MTTPVPSPLSRPVASQAPVAIVTGASSGIGEATSIALAEAGFTVILAARSADLLNRIVKEIVSKGHDAIAIPTDLSDEQQTHQLVAETMARYGKIDVVVNNAGFSPAAALEQLSREEIRRTFEVNLFPALQLISEFTPIMRKQGYGRFINISSMTSRFHSPLAVPYAATKGGMESATACLRLELAAWNIQLSVVIPGFVDTPAFDKARELATDLRNDSSNPYLQTMEVMDEFASAQLGHAATPQNVADVIVSAAIAKSPNAVYFVPASSAIIAFITAVLPVRWTDWLIKKIYKLPY